MKFLIYAILNLKAWVHKQNPFESILLNNFIKFTLQNKKYKNKIKMCPLTTQMTHLKWKYRFFSYCYEPNIISADLRKNLMKSFQFKQQISKIFITNIVTEVNRGLTGLSVVQISTESMKLVLIDYYSKRIVSDHGFSWNRFITVSRSHIHGLFYLNGFQGTLSIFKNLCFFGLPFHFHFHFEAEIGLLMNVPFNISASFNHCWKNIHFRRFLSEFWRKLQQNWFNGNRMQVDLEWSVDRIIVFLLKWPYLLFEW